jgi:hypothetical protein
MRASSFDNTESSHHLIEKKREKEGVKGVKREVRGWHRVDG